MTPEEARQFADVFGEPQCEVTCSNPRAQTPNTDPAIGANPLPCRSLVEGLGEVADDLRQLYTDFGLRPYRLFSVVVSWSGGEIGRGTASVASETEFLPTPKVDVRPLSREATEAGEVERGQIRVSEISPRYTEEDIRVLFHTQPLPAGHEGFVEMRMDGRDGKYAVRHRLIVADTPWRQADKFQWTVRMVAQDEPRSRTGVLPQPVRYPVRLRGD